MTRTLLKSKLHRGTVTGTHLDYEGSISIDPKLCDTARLCPFERVEIYNLANGARFSTYVILGKEGEIALNGAAARLAEPGDQVIIASYVGVDDKECAGYEPTLVYLGTDNRIASKSGI